MAIRLFFVTNPKKLLILKRKTSSRKRCLYEFAKKVWLPIIKTKTQILIKFYVSCKKSMEIAHREADMILTTILENLSLRNLQNNHSETQ